MKQILLLICVLVFVMFLTYWLIQPGNIEKLRTVNLASNSLAPKIPDQKVINIGKNIFKIEVAKTEPERQIGLSKHTTIDANSGMLFIFDKKDTRPSFWMKGMNFPIDIIWINDKKVAQIMQDVPVITGNIPENEIPLYSPSQAIDYVLEIPAGSAKQGNIKVGDTVEIPL